MMTMESSNGKTPTSSSAQAHSIIYSQKEDDNIHNGIYTNDDDDNDEDEDSHPDSSLLLTSTPPPLDFRQLFAALKHRQFCEPPGRARVSSEESVGSWTMLLPGRRTCARDDTETMESKNTETTLIDSNPTPTKTTCRSVSFSPKVETEPHEIIMDHDETFAEDEAEESTVIMVEVEELASFSGWGSLIENIVVVTLLLWALAQWMKHHMGMECQILPAVAEESSLS